MAVEAGKSLEPLIMANKENEMAFNNLKQKELSDSAIVAEKQESPGQMDVDKKKSWKDMFKRDKDKKEKEEEYPPVNPFKIFAFASKFELLLICIGLVTGMIQGAAFPFSFLAIGEAFDAFFTFQAASQGCASNFFANTTSLTGKVLTSSP